MIKRIVGIVLGLFLVSSSPAFSQCTGQFSAGTVCGNPSSSQALPTQTSSPVLGGGSIQGSITLTPGSGAPSSLQNGQLWTTPAGVFAQINGGTVGPFVVAGSGSFAAVEPILVTFPSSVVTFAFDYTFAGTFSAHQTFSAGISVNGSSFTGLANPTATIGLTAVNGSATTAARSDSAPALSQAIIPTWTGLHTFSAGLSADHIIVGSPTGGSEGTGTINATGYYVNGTLIGAFSGFANPTATIGLSAINGTATTALRSDAAPAISQAIVPTWTGLHTFNGGIAGDGPIGMINTTTPVSFTTPGYSFNDVGISGFSFSDNSIHYGSTMTGNTPATGTGSYVGLGVTQFGNGRDSSGFVDGANFNATAIGGLGNYTGTNPYVVICGTAVIAGQCPNGTAATLNSSVGEEIDIFSFAGATTLYKEGLRIADLGAIQASGSGNLSAGIDIVRASASPGFVYGIYFGDPTNVDINFPLTTTGAAIKFAPTARAIDSIVDAAGITGGITSAFRLPENTTAMIWPAWKFFETSTFIGFQFNSGTINALLVEPAASLFSGTIQSGLPGTNAGAVLLLGSSTGTVTIQPGAAAGGTFNFNLPVTAGTTGQPLLSGGGGAGAMTWGTGPSKTCGATIVVANGIVTSC